MTIGKEKFIKIFISESEDYLSILNKGFVILEKQPDNDKLILELERAAHTLKGSAKMMNFTKIQTIAHKLEDILSHIKNKSVGFNPSIATIIFDALALLIEMFKHIKAEGLEGIEINHFVSRVDETLLNGKNIN